MVILIEKNMIRIIRPINISLNLLRVYVLGDGVNSVVFLIKALIYTSFACFN